MKKANLRCHPECCPLARLNVIQFGSLKHTTHSKQHPKMGEVKNEEYIEINN